MDARAKSGALGEREFFPLTGISYVVLKVSPGVCPGLRAIGPQEKLEHRTRLRDILNMNQPIERLFRAK